jgi:hypothetical protein
MVALFVLIKHRSVVQAVEEVVAPTAGVVVATTKVEEEAMEEVEVDTVHSRRIIPV